MRVHASLREDARLWLSAALAAVVVYALVVVVGIAPAPFGLPAFVRSHSAPKVVLAQGAPLGLDLLRRQTVRPGSSGAATAARRPARTSARVRPATARGKPGSVPVQKPAAPPATSRRPPTPSGSSSSHEAAAPTPTAASSSPAPPLTSTPDPPAPPPLPVTVPSVDDVTSAVPPLPVATPPVAVPPVALP